MISGVNSPDFNNMYSTGIVNSKSVIPVAVPGSGGSDLSS